MTHFDESMDRTIDDVARAMTTVPYPSLAVRVLARLRPQPSRRASRLVPVALILATASVAFLVLIRSRPVAVRPPTVTSSAELLKPAATPERPPQVEGRDAHQPAIRRVYTTTNADSEAEAWRESAVPALKAVPDLSMAAIQPTALPIAQLEVAPIAAAEPLVVKAIGSDR